MIIKYTGMSARAASRRRWRERHKEAVAAYNRHWREKNRQHAHAYGKIWRAQNRDVMCAIARRYRERNRLAIKIARALGISVPEARALSATFSDHRPPYETTVKPEEHHETNCGSLDERRA